MNKLLNYWNCWWNFILVSSSDFWYSQGRNCKVQIQGCEWNWNETFQTMAVVRGNWNALMQGWKMLPEGWVGAAWDHPVMIHGAVPAFRGQQCWMSSMCSRWVCSSSCQGRAGCRAPAHSSWTPWSLWSLPAQETQDSVLSVNSVLSVAAGLGCWTPGGLFRGFSSHSQIQKCQKSHLMSSCAIPWCVGVQSLLCHPRLQGQPLLQQGWLAEGDGGVSADPKCFTAELYHSLP